MKDRLHLVRIAKGMNKSEMAKVLHVSVAYVTRLENGERPLPSHVITMLNLEHHTTLRWYYYLMDILNYYSDHNRSPETVSEIKKVLKTILGV